MAMKKSALGKGLGALLEDAAKPDNSINSVVEIDINKIEPGNGQPRTNFDKEKIEALSESIKEHGVIQPIIVKKEDDVYKIIAGERRWRASRLAGLKKIPAIIREASNKDVIEWAIIENVLREDLNPIEEAEAYNRLIKEYNMTQEDVAKVVQKSRSNIANMLRLLNFNERVREMLISGELSIGQARPILALSSDIQYDIAKIIADKGLNARQAETYVKRISCESGKKNTKEESEDDIFKKREIEYMESQLRSQLGTKVKLDDKRGKGKIVIEYFSKDERERLIELLLRTK